MSEWREVRLGDVVEIISGGTPRTTIQEYWDGEIPWISIKDIVCVNKTIFITEKNITSLGLKNSVGNLLYKGDVILSARGTVGEVARLGKDMAFNQSCFGLRGTEVLNDFLFYLLKYARPLLITAAGGATFDTIIRKTFNHVKLKVPSKQTQEKIANILSAYDKLIENNNRRIQILEQTAEELYKEWFVRMRFSGYEKTKFEKGIPKGWEVQKLSEVIKVTDGTHDTPKEVSDGRPLVTGKNIVNGQIDFNTTYNISEDDYKKINVRSSVEKNDILYSNIGTIGQMSIVHDDNKYSVKNLIILKTSKYNFYEYIYLHFKNEACQNHFDSIANGASQRFISLTEMRNYKILIPNKDILEEFRSYVRILFNQVKNLTIQNQNLAKQRDLLLPRLMNGTISVE